MSAATSQLPDGGRFVALDSWRGIAALSVAWHHINADSGLTAGEWNAALYLMVDFFFVLSGFVIAGAYGERLSRGFSLARFMWLRLGRIYPLHLAMVALYVVLELGAAVFLADGSGARVPFTGPRDPSALPAVLLLVQAFLHPAADLWNAPSWSISVELWLYLAAALAWRYLHRWGPLAGLVLGIATLAFFFDYGPVVERWGAVLRGLGGFGLGMAAWEMHRRAGRWSRVSSRTGTAAEVLAVGLAAALLTNPFGPGLFTPTCVLLVLVFAQERGLLSRLLHAAPFVFLGTISYSLYMTHGFVIGRLYDGLGVVARVFDRGLVDSHLTAADHLVGPGWQVDLISVAMVVLVVPPAWLAWRLLENPAREWSRRRAARWGVAEAERVAPTI